MPFAITAVYAQDAVPEASHAAPVFIEPLSPDPEPTDRYGVPVNASFIKWRPMCGSDTSALTVEDLMSIAAQHAQLEEQFAGGARSPLGTGLNIILNTSPQVPADVQQALETAAGIIEELFGDDISMTILVDWQDMGGSVLGATGSSQSSLSYSSVRDMLQDDMDLDDGIQDFLPAGNSIPVRYDEGSAIASNENDITVTWGNLRALGGSTSQTVASMTFNSSFPWDLDPSNGISGGTWDFQSVAVHEIGHAMGFVSEVDDPGNSMAVLDLFRFRDTDGCCDYDPDTFDEFTDTPRIADYNLPNDGHTFDIITVEHRLSDGSPYQASHFREQNPSIGIMDPAIGSGQSYFPDFFQDSDLDVFDALGWDYPVELDFIELPVFDNFPGVELDSALWTGVDGAEGSTRGLNEPSPDYSLNLDATQPGGEQVRSAFMDLTVINDPVLNYWYERTGTDDPPEPGDDLVIDYLASDGVSWVELQRHFGAGPDMAVYEFVSLELPPEAIHSAVRFRLRSISDDSGSDDDWFIDDLCIGSSVDCPLPAQCPEDLDGDSQVGTTDLLELLSLWGTDPAGPPDLNGDHTVDTNDLLTLLAAWGPC